MSDDRFLTRWWDYCRSNSKSEHKGGTLTLSLWHSGHKAEQNSLLQRWWWRKEEAAEQGKVHSLWSSICGKSKHVPVTEATAFTVGGIIMPKALLWGFGFKAAGIAKGSIAAAIQCKVYGGATSGLFSIFQSAGVAGLGLVPIAVLGVTSIGVVWLVQRTWTHHQHESQPKQSSVITFGNKFPFFR